MTSSSTPTEGKIPLSELTLLIVDCEHKTAPTSETGYPLIRTPNIGRGRFELADVQRVDEATYEEWTRRTCPQPGDLIMAREAPVGNVAVIKGDLAPALGQRTVLIRPDPEHLDSDYLCYRLSTNALRGWMTGVSNGATVPHLNLSDIRNLPLIELPPLVEQRKIGSCLRAFDDLIENNRRRIELLEETARLLYREWFVNFRYPGHEDVPLVDSELGPIPEGWEVRMVGSVCELIRGRSYKRAELVDLGGLPFLNLKCVSRGGGFRLDGIKRYQGSFKPTQKTYPGETVIAMTDMTQDRGVVAQAARVPHLDEGFGVISLDLNRVIPNPGVDPDYLYAMFRHSAFSKAVREFANGVNVLHLSPSSIESYNFALPPDPLQKLFGDSVRPGLKLVDRLQQQSETLAEARDLLLPRLVSGDLDISDLDLDLEAVG